MRKIVLAMLLVAFLPANSFAAAGAQLVLKTKDGREIRGELLAVKHHCLILKDESGAGFTVDFNDLTILKEHKASRMLSGLAFGLAAGTVLGAAIRYASGKDALDDPRQAYLIFPLMELRPRTAIIGGLLGAVVGSLSGALIGHAASVGTQIDLEKRSSEEIEEILVWLRPKARFPEESY